MSQASAPFDAPAFLADLVREKSRQGLPAPRAELTAALVREAADLDAAGIEAAFAALPLAHPDVAALDAPEAGQAFYHCPAQLSRAYARIMAVRDAPVTLMAATIRENSREYPRPVPLDLFELPPFDLTPEQIKDSLAAMAAAPDHADITFTTSSAGTVYLFSTRHLTRDHAAFLAEQADVGDVNNP